MITQAADIAKAMSAAPCGHPISEDLQRDAVHPATTSRSSRRSQAEYEQNRGLALVAQFDRVDELGARHRARSRGDCDVLLAIDFERHGRGGESGANVDLP